MNVILALRQAIQAQGIESRTGHLRITVKINHSAPLGASYGNGDKRAAAWGEEVSISIGTDAKTLATGTWKSVLPGAVPANFGNGFVPAPIDSKELITVLSAVANGQITGVGRTKPQPPEPNLGDLLGPHPTPK